MCSLFSHLFDFAHIICMFFRMSLLLPKDVSLSSFRYCITIFTVPSLFHTCFFCNFPYFWNIFFPCHFSEAGTTAQVPSVTASVVTLPEAFRPTAFRSALHGPDTWRCRLEVENPMGKPRSEAMIRNGKPRVNQHRCGKTHGFPWENGGCSKSMLVDRRVTRSWY